MPKPGFRVWQNVRVTRVPGFQSLSHSSSNVGRSGGQYPWRRARSITELMSCRSDALVRPRHALAAYVRRATTVARNTCCRAASSSPLVRRTRNAWRHQPLDVLTDREVISDAHVQHLHTAAARYSRLRRFCCLWKRSQWTCCSLVWGCSAQLISSEFREPRRLVAGEDDDVRVVGIFAQRVSRRSGDEIKFRANDLNLSWKNGPYAYEFKVLCTTRNAFYGTRYLSNCPTRCWI